MCASIATSIRHSFSSTSSVSASSPFSIATASSKSFRYISYPTASIWPCCLFPKSEPAPRISRSRIAILKPEPNSVYSLIASSLRVAISVSSLPRVKVKYAYALRDDLPTLPRIWWSCASPIRSAFSIIRVLQFGTSTPVSIIVVQTRISISPSIKSFQTLDSCSSVILPWAIPTLASGRAFFICIALCSIVSVLLWR